MDTFLLILRYAAGPVLGALIGYFTNWLAVKMLFRPYYPKKIGKLRLPFTPGIIPKRKQALAKAVGKAVGEELFTKEDLSDALTSDSAKDRIAEFAVNKWHEVGEKTADDLTARLISREKADSLKDSAQQFVGDKIYSAVLKFDLGKVVADECAKVVKDRKSSLGMLAMFLSDELVSSIAEKIAVGVNGYVEDNGKQVIADAVKNELNAAFLAPLASVTDKIDDETVRTVARTLYDCAVKKIVGELAENVNISAIVEEKINAMDVKELEKLVLSVMKKELNAIVNLGALIGFILGIIMIFV